MYVVHDQKLPAPVRTSGSIGQGRPVPIGGVGGHSSAPTDLISRLLGGVVVDASKRGRIHQTNKEDTENKGAQGPGEAGWVDPGTRSTQISRL